MTLYDALFVLAVLMGCVLAFFVGGLISVSLLNWWGRRHPYK